MSASRLLKRANLGHPGSVSAGARRLGYGMEEIVWADERLSPGQLPRRCFGLSARGGCGTGNADRVPDIGRRELNGPARGASQ